MRIVAADAAARLDHRPGDPVDGEGSADDMRRPRQRIRDRRRIALPMGEGDVVRAERPDRRRGCAERVVDRGHRGQGLVVDRDALGRVQRQGFGLGDDEGDRIADEPHPVPDQRGPRRVDHRRAVGPRKLVLAGQAAVAVGVPVAAVEHGQDPRHPRRLRRVDGGDPGMRMGRAQDDAVCEAFEGDVVEIAAAAGQQPAVVLPGNRGADPVGRHRGPAPLGRCAIRPRRAPAARYARPAARASPRRRTSPCSSG